MTPWVLLGLMAMATGTFAGLWWGERGRRLDAQRVASGHRLTPRRPAIVDGASPPEGRQGKAEPRAPIADEPPTTPAEPMFDHETRERMLVDFMHQHDVDEETAEKAIEEITATIFGEAGIS